MLFKVSIESSLFLRKIHENIEVDHLPGYPEIRPILGKLLVFCHLTFMSSGTSYLVGISMSRQSHLQSSMARSRRFFYFLVIISLIVALFFSILLGLIIFIGDVAYFFYLGRSAKKSGYGSFANVPDQPQEPAAQEETIIERESVKIPCKYCKTLIDPVTDKTCPNCGAPIDLT